MLAATLCHPELSSGMPRAVDDLIGQLVMCSGHGAAVAASTVGKAMPVASAAEVQAPKSPGSGTLSSDIPSPELPSRPAGEHCPACAVVQALALLVVVAALSLLTTLPDRPLAPWLRAARELLPDHLRSGSVRSRAPPLPA